MLSEGEIHKLRDFWREAAMSHEMENSIPFEGWADGLESCADMYDILLSDPKMAQSEFEEIEGLIIGGALESVDDYIRHQKLLWAPQI